VEFGLVASLGRRPPVNPGIGLRRLLAVEKEAGWGKLGSRKPMHGMHRAGRHRRRVQRRFFGFSQAADTVKIACLAPFGALR
jgi:hypothetical protein